MVGDVGKCITKLSRAILELFIDVRNDVFAHLETLCDSDGVSEEELDFYMDPPFHSSSTSTLRESVSNFDMTGDNSLFNDYDVPTGSSSSILSPTENNVGRNGSVGVQRRRKVVVSFPIRKRQPTKRRVHRRVELDQAQVQLAREHDELEELQREIERFQNEQKVADQQLQQLGKQLQHLKLVQRRLHN